MLNSYEAKKEAKIQRCLELADKAEQRAKQYDESANRISSYVPLGQPILVGHHSEKRHRRHIITRMIPHNLHD